VLKQNRDADQVADALTGFRSYRIFVVPNGEAIWHAAIRYFTLQIIRLGAEGTTVSTVQAQFEFFAVAYLSIF